MKAIKTEETALEFDRWAKAGRAEAMESGHRLATGTLLDGWEFDASSVVLDIGCGSGWAARWMLERGAAHAIGVDLSDEMVALASRSSDDRARFFVASAESIALDDSSVSHLLSVEAIYYVPDPAAALREWARIAAPGATLGIMVDLYAESEGTHCWLDALPIGAHLLSEPELVGLIEAAGFTKVRTRRVVDSRPLPDRVTFKPSDYWPNYEMLLAYRAAGSLIIDAVKPAH